MISLTKVEKINLGLNIVSAIFIGVASICLSLASYRISVQQTEVSKVEHRPFFYISNSFSWDDKGKKIVQETINVHNIGAPIANVDIDIQELLSLEYKNKGGYYVKKTFPLNGYYFVNQPTGNPKNLLGTSWGYENYKSFSELYRQARDKKYFSKRGVVTLDVISIVKISYLNRLGRTHVRYFVDEEMVDKHVYEEYRKYRDNLKMIDIDEVSADSLFELADEND